MDNQGNIKSEYIGMDGYASFTDTHFKGDMLRTYKNISAVLDKELMRKLGWQQFQGTTKEYKKLRELILDNQGNIKSEYIGMDGYASFANTHFKGDMQKTYSNISAV